MNQAGHDSRTRRFIATLEIVLLASCLVLGHGCSPGGHEDPKPASETKQARLAIADEHYRTGCDFFEGVVMKRADSIYPVQMRSATEEFRGWAKHRFLT